MKTIRRATVDDAAAVAAIYAPYCEEAAISFELTAPPVDEIARRITTVGARRPWLVLEDESAVNGYAYASAHHEREAYQWSASTAIYVSQQHHGRGIGKALYTTLFDVLRHLGYFKATAGITLPNAASVGIHEAFGFTLVGVYRDIGFKHGAWRDVAWYQAALQPLVPNPAPPRSIESLTGTPEWEVSVAQGLAHYVQHS